MRTSQPEGRALVERVMKGSVPSLPPHAEVNQGPDNRPEDEEVSAVVDPENDDTYLGYVTSFE